jgi:hypothetical protein
MSFVSRTDLAFGRTPDFDAFDLAELLLLFVHAASDGRTDRGARRRADDCACAVSAALIADDRAGHATDHRADDRAAFGLAIRIGAPATAGLAVIRRGAGEGEDGDENEDETFSKHLTS